MIESTLGVCIGPVQEGSPSVMVVGGVVNDIWGRQEVGAGMGGVTAAGPERGRGGTGTRG